MYEMLEQLLSFEFANVGILRDRELYLAVSQRTPLNLHSGYVPTYDFHMRLDGQRGMAGRISLRVGNTPEVTTYMGHIGYGVEPEFRGGQLAARSCRLLFALARRHSLDPLWITCNPENWASRRTCELIGGELVEIVDVPPDHSLHMRGEIQKCRYRIPLTE